MHKKRTGRHRFGKTQLCQCNRAGASQSKLNLEKHGSRSAVRACVPGVVFGRGGDPQGLGPGEEGGKPRARPSPRRAAAGTRTHAYEGVYGRSVPQSHALQVERKAERVKAFLNSSCSPLRGLATFSL